MDEQTGFNANEDILEVDVLFQTDVTDRLSESRIAQIITEVCVAIAQREDLAASDLSVLLVDDAAICQLNRDYRGRDQVTDVLSFSLLEGDEPEVEDDAQGRQALGDIVMSWPRLCLQAGDYGHSIERELAFLVAHGMLHLLGYDHETQAEETRMFERQEEILVALHYTR